MKECLLSVICFINNRIISSHLYHAFANCAVPFALIIFTSVYNNRESRWFAHIRKNENEADLSGSAAQGVGASDSTTATTATFLLKPTNIYVGDTLFQITGGNTPQEVGEVQSISDKTITLTNVINAPAQNTFMFAKKNARIDGAEIRGRFLEITLRSDETDFIECFAVNVRAIKSYL